MAAMATSNAILKNGDIPTKSNISQLLLIIALQIVTKLKRRHMHFILWSETLNYLICIFMNINEYLKNEGKIIKNTIYKLILAPNNHQTTIRACFISSVIQLDKSFTLVVPFKKYPNLHIHEY